MTRIVLFTALTFASADAGAGPGNHRAERTACTADYDKYCKGTFPGGGRIIKCLASHYEKLGGACKKVVDAHKK